MILRERPAWSGLALARTAPPRDAVFSNYSREILASALRSTLARHRNDGRVIIPNFVCNTLIDAVLAAGGQAVFHGLDPDLTPRLNEVEALLDRGAAAWLVVDYFGMQPEIPPALLEKARSTGCVIIHDGAHSFLSLMTNSERAVSGFDYSVFSVYKSLAIGCGAIGIGGVPMTQGVSLMHMVMMAARKVAKHAVATMAKGRFVNRGMERLQRLSPEPIRPRGGSAAGVAVVRFLVRHRDYARVAARHFDAAERIAAAASAARLDIVFDAAQRRDNVLQGFPLRLESQALRDQLLAYFRRHRIDAYTWPTFSTLGGDEPLWARLVVLPVHPRVAEVLAAFRSSSPGEFGAPNRTD